MTNVYFVRHAQPNYENHDDLTRELTRRDCKTVSWLRSFSVIRR